MEDLELVQRITAIRRMRRIGADHHQRTALADPWRAGAGLAQCPTTSSLGPGRGRGATGGALQQLNGERPQLEYQKAQRWF